MTFQMQQEIPQIGCEKCDGYGNIITPQGIRPCECKVRAMTSSNLASSGIPTIFTKKSFETFHTRTKNQKQVYERCRKYVMEYSAGSKGLLFMGTCGTGKTHLAVSILRELILKGNTGLFYNIISLLDDLRASYALDSNVTQWPILEKVCGVDILVLDDLGAEKTSGWVNDRLYAIINHRYEHSKTTLITTNRSMESTEEKDNESRERYESKEDYGLKAQIGYRIYSRLMEMCQTIPFDGNDYRIEMMRSGKV